MSLYKNTHIKKKATAATGANHFSERPSYLTVDAGPSFYLYVLYYTLTNVAKKTKKIKQLGTPTSKCEHGATTMSPLTRMGNKEKPPLSQHS